MVWQGLQLERFCGETKMKKYVVKAKGTNPLMWNRSKLELAKEMKKLKKDQLMEYEEKNWKKKAEYMPNGNLVIPIE